MRKIGKVKEAHGLKGDLYILIFSKDVSWLSKLETFALGLEDDPKAQRNFRVEKAKPFKDGLMLKAEGLPDRTQAEKLKGHLFYVPESLFETEEGETIYLSEVAGFEILGPEKEKLGRIVGFSTNGAQDLLVVEKSSGGQAEIPFVEDFILHIDFDSQFVQMKLPEGIWDLQAL
jgi:16S rRNA processing protein RimM